MAIGDLELAHECFSEHLRMGTVRKKQDKETKEGKQIREYMERSTAGTKKKSRRPSCCSGIQQYLIIEQSLHTTIFDHSTIITYNNI